MSEIVNSNGRETVSQFCQNQGVSKIDLMTANSNQPIPTFLQGLLPYSSVKEYLVELEKNNQPIISGIDIVIPDKTKGGLGNVRPSTAIYNSNLSTVKSSMTTSHLFWYQDSLWYQNAIAQRKFKCKYWILNQHGSRQGNISYTVKEGYLPVFPNEVSNSVRARYNAQPIMGRSVDYQIYTGSERSFSLTLKLHAELFMDLSVSETEENPSGYLSVNNQLKGLVADIESACYPLYESDGSVIPPEFALQIGEQFYIKGVLESVTANWSAPIIDEGLVNCELSLSIVETNGPYSADQIRQMKGFHGDRTNLNVGPYQLTTR